MTVSEDYPGPLNFNRGALANSVVVPGCVVVYGCLIYSSKAATQWIHFYDADTVPAEGAVPLFTWNFPALAGIGFGWQPNGRQFQTGMVICNSSTETTKTIGSADCFFDVQFDTYEGQNPPGTGR